MTKTTQRLRTFTKLPLALAVAASISAPAGAFQFELGEMSASLDTTLTAGASWRVAEREKYLLGAGNYYADTSTQTIGSVTGPLAWHNPEGAGSSINNDDGNWNFDKGDTYSEIVKGVTELKIDGDGYGFFGRARYWYDFKLKRNNFDTDNVGKQRELSVDGKKNASGGEILDAYIWKDFLVGEKPLNLRIGKQVVSWGESTFVFNGINVINPIDITAIRAPGAELKDALLPVNMVYGSLGLSDTLTIEAFVQLDFEHTRIEDCGTFFSNVDYVADGCGPVIVSSRGLAPVTSGALAGISFVTEDQLLNFPAGFPAAVNRNEALERKWYPDGEDQYGVALRWYVPELNDTEFGFYFIQYHNRFPTVTGTNGRFNVPGYGGAIPAFTPGFAPTYARDYMKRIKLFGISFNTVGPMGISIGGEYSFKQGMPLQTNAFDALFNGFGVMYTPQTTILNPNAAQQNNALYSYIDPTTASTSGAEIRSDRYDVSQLQFTGIHFIDQVLGASRLALVGEVGFTYVHDLPDESVNRYGRYAQLGFGTTVTDYVNETIPVGINLTPQQACENIFNFNNAGCTTEGYTTDFSWGYRLRAELSYSNAFAGVNLHPGLYWSHDVSGYSPEPGGNFFEDRKSIGVSLRADYLNQYSAEISYTNYFGGIDGINPLVDKDNVSVSVSYAF